VDYTDAKVYSSETAAKRAKASAVGGDASWWNCETPEERHKSLITFVKQLETDSQDRAQANLRYARLYENVELETMNDFAGAIVRQTLLGRGIVRMNVIAACCDTLAAKVTKNKPRPQFQTSGGSWDAQMKGRRLNKFGIGLFYELKAHELLKESFDDAEVFGTGLTFLYMDRETKRLCGERVIPDEIFVENADAQYGKPASMYRRKRVARERLIEMFPGAAEALMRKGEEPISLGAASAKARTPMLTVWEAWHLPCGKRAGCHVIAVDGAELFSEPWKLKRFPFVVQRFKKRKKGFWGKGIAEALTGLQLELNRLLNSISEQLRRKGRGRIFVQKGTSVTPSHLTNGIADIVNYVGTPPQVDNQNAVAQEEFNEVDRLYQRAFQEVGISELSASAKKPSGLDAAVALREFSDIESERFALTHQDWENAHLDLMNLALDLIDAYGNQGYKVRLPNKRYFKEIDYAEIKLARDSYTMQVFPVSSLPQTPGARYQKVVESMQDGFIDKATASRLLDYPDIEAEMNLGNAARDDVDYVISAILDEPEPKLMPVEPYQNLPLLVERATAAYLFARHHDCPEERLELLRQLIDDAAAALQAATQPPALPGAPAGPPPSGAPPGGPPGMGAPPMRPAGGPPMGARIGGDITVNAAPPVQPVAGPVVAG
jgi:hypothetical protein